MGIDPPAPFHPTATRKVRSVVDVKIAPVVVVLGSIDTSGGDTITNTIDMDIDSTTSNNITINNNPNINILSEPMICITNHEQYYENEEETAATNTNTIVSSSSSSSSSIINIVVPIKKQLELFETWDECTKRIVQDDMKIPLCELESKSVVTTEFLYASNHIDYENNRHCIIIYMLLTITLPNTSTSTNTNTTTDTTGTNNNCYQSIIDDINSTTTRNITSNFTGSTNIRKVRMYEYMTLTELQTKSNTVPDSIHPDLLHVVQDILPIKLPQATITTGL